jgi:hypothetical protein
MWLGHEACNRYVHGHVLFEEGRPPAFHPLWLEGETLDESAVLGYLERYGGASFRRDRPVQARTRFLAMVARNPAFWAGRVVPYVWARARRMAPGSPLGLALRLLRGRARTEHFNIVSHHFMSREDIETAEGRERLDLCVFRLPVGDKLVSMCEVNALGLRDRVYEDIRAGAWAGRSLASLETPFAPTGRASGVDLAEEALKGEVRS